MFKSIRKAGGIAALCAAVALPTASAAPQAAAQAPRRPNIIVILADDLGYNDISLNGQTVVRTPNIDSLARDGVRFTQAYSSDAVCAPSRAGLLTGRYQQRFGFESNVPPAGVIENALAERAAGKVDDDHEPGDIMQAKDLPPLAPPEQRGIPDTETTWAQTLKAAGYRTAAYGKWHVGYAPNLLPAARGFDESLIFPGGASLMAPADDPKMVNAPLPWSTFDTAIWKRLKAQLMRNGKVEPVKDYMTYQLADEAVDFIGRNKDRPFAIYLAFNAPHNPLQAPKDIYDRMGHIPEHQLRVYYSMIVALDDSIGRVIRKLEAEGLDQDTIVVFASDNGAASYIHSPTSNLPNRGWKTTYFQGGFNVPMMIRWPRRLPAGEVIRAPASLLDLAPTLLSAGQAQRPGGKPLDGRNLMPIMTEGRDDLTGRTLFWRSEHYHAVLQGDFKLQVSKYPDKVWLYNLRTDPGERSNLAEAMPDKVKAMRALVDAHDKELVTPNWPHLGRRRIWIDGDISPRPKDAEFIYWALSTPE
ncbi:sulfatase-like hydrolase/transferase [Phenylobacterium sp. VNQ135]|uniref:sulfatase-like hydrolase/transferase n=1 Tax=Phenylobacterium sp. VNQ135 TaxID=3400922 RepID=UPI003C001875